MVRAVKLSCLQSVFCLLNYVSIKLNIAVRRINYLYVKDLGTEKYVKALNYIILTYFYLIVTKFNQRLTS